MARIIVLKFQCLTNPVLVKKLLIPSHDPNLFDVDVLKEILLKEMLEDNTVRLLGGNEKTTIDDISIMKYDEDVDEEIDVHRSEVFCRIEKNVLVKLRQTDHHTSFITHTAGTDDVFEETRHQLKRKTSQIDGDSSAPVESDSSSVYDPDISTDIVDSSSDQNAQDPLKKKKKPRYEKKPKKRKNVEVVTKTPMMPTAFDSSMGIDPGYYINAVFFIKLYFLLPI
jgi:hypothetical protein